MKSEELIKSYVRLKPVQNDQISSLSCNRREVFVNRTKESFSFHEVFNETSSNQYIYDRIINPILPDLFNGFNACILAYGQTSSGKTYTMKGVNKSLGLIPLCIKQIFKRIKYDELCAKVTISYYEIYNENLIDLLSDDQLRYLEIRDDGKKNLTIPELKEIELKDQIEALSFYEKGQLKRKSASNSINFSSSRSHTIFLIRFSVVNENHQLAQSCIHMVDLAGSESISKTNATGVLKKQSENINKSLLCLTTAIRAISERQTFVNFRGSKLTRVLQQCLSGNSKTFVICTVKQTQDCMSQTINTLRFGLVANTIKNELRQNLADSQQLQKQQDESRYKSLLSILQQQRKTNQKLQQEVLRKDREVESRKQQSIRLKKELQDAKHSLLVLQNSNRHHTTMIDFYKKKEEKENGQKNLFLQNSQQSLSLIQNQNRGLKSTIGNLQQNIDLKTKKIAVLQKNQRGLLDRIQKYEEQLNSLQEMMKSNQNLKQSKKKLEQTQNRSGRIPSQPVQQPKNKNKRLSFHQIGRYNPPESGKLTSPFTIRKVIQMSTTILSMKIELNHYLNAISDLHNEIYSLQAKIQEISEKKQQASPPTGSRRESANLKSKIDDRAAKNYEMKLQKLKKENEKLKKKNIHYLKILKKCANNNIQTLAGFNQYIEKNHQHSEKSLFQLLMNDSSEDYQPINAYTSTISSRLANHTQIEQATQQESTYSGPVSSFP